MRNLRSIVESTIPKPIVLSISKTRLLKLSFQGLPFEIVNKSRKFYLGAFRKEDVRR